MSYNDLISIDHYIYNILEGLRSFLLGVTNIVANLAYTVQGIKYVYK